MCTSQIPTIALVVLCTISTTLALAVRQAASSGNKACSINGKTVVHGDTFLLNSIAGPCVQFTCDNGETLPGPYGCERDGKCFPEGNTYNIGCIQRRCSVLNGNFGYKRINEGCSIKNVCLTVNETYQDGCFKYRCTKGGSSFSVTYSLDLIEWGCTSGGQCYKEGHQLEIQCRKMECRKVHGVAGFVNTEQGCPFGDKCISVGQTTEDACRTFQCTKTDVNGIPFYSVDVVNVKCEDANLDCRDPGTYFPYKMGGAVRQNCTCHTEGLNIQYFC